METLYKFTDILTTAEASDIWKISQTTIKQLCTGVQGRPPRLQIGIECRKSGSTWLVTRAGMIRLYGEPNV